MNIYQLSGFYFYNRRKSSPFSSKDPNLNPRKSFRRVISLRLLKPERMVKFSRTGTLNHALVFLVTSSLLPHFLFCLNLA